MVPQDKRREETGSSERLTWCVCVCDRMCVLGVSIKNDQASALELIEEELTAS